MQCLDVKVLSWVIVHENGQQNKYPCVAVTRNKTHTHTHMLIGPSISRAEHIRAKSDLQRDFTLVLESQKEDLKLVDPRFYRLAAKRVGVEPHQLIYGAHLLYWYESTCLLVQKYKY